MNRHLNWFAISAALLAVGVVLHLPKSADAALYRFDYAGNSTPLHISDSGFPVPDGAPLPYPPPVRGYFIAELPSVLNLPYAERRDAIVEYAFYDFTPKIDPETELFDSSFATDAAGIPTEWDLFAANFGGGAGTTNRSGFAFDEAGGQFYGFSVSGNPGTWSVKVVPVPAAGILFATALGVMGLFTGRRCKASQ